ncbi:MAG: glycosyltransferase family 9 protein [Verrucomicrobiales bacterium]|nr:glycosyltransferase family 9 protein [Verrucomicrobiales bacterium]
MAGGKILFIRGGAIGDFILTLPAIQLVRDTLPNARLEVLGYDSITSLAKASSLVAATRSIEHGPMAGFFVPDGKLDPELMDYFSSFSVVISYLYDSAGFFRANVERCRGGDFIQGPHVIDVSLTDQSAAMQLAKPLESLAMFLEQPYIELPRRDPDNGDAAWKKLITTSTRPRIALHPGSGSARKNWSFESWVDVAKQLQAKFPLAEFLIISGEAEDRSISEFLELIDHAKINCSHLAHVELPTLSNVLQQCDLFLGHDSGISHLAGACALPSLLLFGPTCPQLWAPKNPAVRTIQAPKGDLSRIKAEQVVKNAVEILST